MKMINRLIETVKETCRLWVACLWCHRVMYFLVANTYALQLTGLLDKPTCTGIVIALYLMMCAQGH